MTDTQIAHDKAIAFAQATIQKLIEDAEKSSSGKSNSVSLAEQADLFNYQYANALKYFLEHDNDY